MSEIPILTDVAELIAVPKMVEENVASVMREYVAISQHNPSYEETVSIIFLAGMRYEREKHRALLVMDEDI